MVSAVSGTVTGILYPTVRLSNSLSNLEASEVARRSSLSTYGLATSRTALDKALEAGKFILENLSKIQSQLLHADMDGVVADSTAARFRRQGEIAVLLAEIDQAVSLAENNGVNLIASTSSDYVLSTTTEGGTLRVSPQPLDTPGLNIAGLSIQPLDTLSLGLDDLGIISNQDIADAHEAIDTALKIATYRFSLLEELGNVVNSGSSFLSQINNLLNQIDATNLPAGTFIDVVA